MNEAWCNVESQTMDLSPSKSLTKGKRVAVVHDWLVTYAGAEKVLRAILELFPSADLYVVCDFLKESDRTFLDGRNVKTSFIQKLPFAARHYRSYMPLMPLAVEQFDLRSYDIIISSSHAVSKGVITGPDQFHVSYIHSPMRYAWDLQHQYLELSNSNRGIKSLFLRYLLHRLRLWDLRSSFGVDMFVANSCYISRRIMKCYRRSSIPIYPPVDTSRFEIEHEKGDYYLTISRLVPYKRVDLVVDAFKCMPDRKLIVIGSGPELASLSRSAVKHKNIRFLGFQDDAVVRTYLQNARAFVFAAEEDFGIAPVEALACGTPVIAYGRGGACETVKGLEEDVPTGVHFDAQSVDSVCGAIKNFEEHENLIRPENCRRSALNFSPAEFNQNFMRCIEDGYRSFLSRMYFKPES